MTEDLFATPDAGAPQHDVLTVRQLGERIKAALEESFPGSLWVKGEIQRLPADAARRKHIYFELHETGQSGAAEYQIPVALMEWDRRAHGLGRYLDGTDPDLQLANKLEVCFEVKVDFYPPFGKLSLKIIGVDKTYALGRLEALRRQVLEFLKTEGLLEKQQQLELAELPLRIGLITSPGSAAERDFMTGIEGSGFPFAVTLRGAKMQGAQVQDEVMRALAAHVRSGVDVIVITRGGGSRADLSWFDQKDLAVAVAESPVPVITAIGHEIDTSICDVVAHHHCKTPTAAAEYLVERVEQAAERCEAALDRLLQAVAEILERARQRQALGERLQWASERALLRSRRDTQRLAARLQNRVMVDLKDMDGRLAGLGRRLAARTGAAVAAASGRCRALEKGLAAAPRRVLHAVDRRVEDFATRLPRAAQRPLAHWSQRLEHWTMQTRLLDPARLLARGYTMTLGVDGALIKRAADLAPGQTITTRFADGEARSIVQPGTGQMPRRKVRKKTQDKQDNLELF